MTARHHRSLLLNQLVWKRSLGQLQGYRHQVHPGLQPNEPLKHQRYQNPVTPQGLPGWHRLEDRPVQVLFPVQHEGVRAHLPITSLLGKGAALFQPRWPGVVRKSAGPIALRPVRPGDPVGKRPQASGAQSYP